MTKLSERVQGCGLCGQCNDSKTYYITMTEAKRALAVVKEEIIQAVDKESTGFRSLDDIIECIKNVE